ncbi:MAG: hypothetical protein ACXWKC_12805, partial [Xanthobacteraceae bacterium]
MVLRKLTGLTIKEGTIKIAGKDGRETKITDGEDAGTAAEQRVQVAQKLAHGQAVELRQGREVGEDEIAHAKTGSSRKEPGIREVYIELKRK